MFIFNRDKHSILAYTVLILYEMKKLMNMNLNQGFSLTLPKLYYICEYWNNSVNFREVLTTYEGD
jgi:hypothetical protein